MPQLPTLNRTKAVVAAGVVAGSLTVVGAVAALNSALLQPDQVDFVPTADTTAVPEATSTTAAQPSTEVVYEDVYVTAPGRDDDEDDDRGDRYDDDWYEVGDDDRPLGTPGTVAPAPPTTAVGQTTTTVDDDRYDDDRDDRDDRNDRADDDRYEDDDDGYDD